MDANSREWNTNNGEPVGFAVLAGNRVSTAENQCVSLRHTLDDSINSLPLPKKSK